MMIIVCREWEAPHSIRLFRAFPLPLLPPASVSKKKRRLFFEAEEGGGTVYAVY